ncbi:hypothetical protein EUGRSUZ_C02052 [Eucalyptus grandis]|uniref:Uncharacterized protein n=2 Tax=Eucalyptus grandis TaxID=71139 RepID=A0ACC3LEK7_EUCGR|nr:hypothetical protein EUGRSUZ_C02052 [Eucalyptus grandis]
MISAAKPSIIKPFESCTRPATELVSSSFFQEQSTLSFSLHLSGAFQTSGKSVLLVFCVFLPGIHLEKAIDWMLARSTSDLVLGGPRSEDVVIAELPYQPHRVGHHSC